MSSCLIEAVFKKVFTNEVVTVIINPTMSMSQIYNSIMPTISTHFPNLQHGEIEIVMCGQEVNGQPENAPHIKIDNTIFKNLPYWRGHGKLYSFYTRRKLVTNGSNCAICFEGISNMQTPFICGHGFCQECITPWIHIDNTCPSCRSQSSPHYHLPIPPQQEPCLNYMNGVLNILLNHNQLLQPDYINNYINIQN